MTRITLLLLTIGAFAYAVWLVLRGRPLPQPGGTRGLKRRFLLATLLFAGLLSQVVGRQSAAGASDPALSEPNAPPHAVAPEDLWVTIKTVWRTLDPNQAEVFRQHLEAAVADGQVRQRVADILSTAFTQIATHNALTRPEGYSPAPVPIPPKRSLQGLPEFPSETALQQLELLRAAKETGIMDPFISQHIHSVLAKEIEMMWLLRRAKPDEWMALDSLWQRYVSSASPIDSATVAARIIVESEGETMSSLTSLARFQTMQSQVRNLLAIGPVFSDWQDRSVRPNIQSMLQELRLAEPPHVTCYRRSLPSITERTAELQALQTELLRGCVDANVIDKQIAAWAADPNGADPDTVDSHTVPLPVDFAIEAEIRAFQKQIRCVMVKLYEQGEVPSSFVRDVELAADIEILPVDPNEARHRDMGYFLHVVLSCPSKTPFAAVLEDRGLIPPAQNHRIWTRNYKVPCEASPDENDLAEFIALLDGNADVTLNDDERLIWPTSLLPAEDIEYRLTMRRVCRILTKLGYTETQWLAAMDQAIGIPTVATISEEVEEIIRVPSGK